MKHAEAVQVLPELRSGGLDRAARAQVLSHLETCEDCRDWLATHDLLRAELGGSAQSEEHPDSGLLALCVVRSEELAEPDRQDLAGHLNHCPACQSELETVRSAVHAARPGSSVEGQAPSASPSAARQVARPLALAATVVVGVFLLAMAWEWGILDNEDRRAAVETSPSPIGEMGDTEPVEMLSGKDLQGTQTIRSESRLAASDLAVSPGADVSMKARDAVVFGDGFRVASGARLTVTAKSVGGRSLEEKLQ